MDNTKTVSIPSNSLHRAMFKKQAYKVAKTRVMRSKFASPTDRLLSPCSQKLSDHRSKLFKTKTNPTRLQFSKECEDW
ncbi:BNS1 (YGR230W) and SPO12 (YHR152W) [Zygosaccharomyces parabailii]|uniref:BN860_15258g1_1 n=1 Tax=Zygosaccharomyces bailii (strain CLIB 213 / ATCC 58445 / CBS 680 / BCRC 21525 / NBRC 1098 / NCYC 1416 / NRRL Y-2227) TaxID=1333698 RepID=A0A8J2T4M4_ZYGB2|nr:BNS1 (YGR230W) and SPO12 (YHR152W) [Zygosaccharomyces parabailii]AQZ17406.1 BNS1 (YGR230W) and SPO12 (YHR152W) [Zygosaccharomyces parabailii]CDF87822.1 BN860_15258g1_1 [Zygosaccharomyces bailii CLIB 213]SJM83614.1 uncharacterized protein ZBIST_1172 [Zygosaccharomyces bailii]